MQLYLEQLQAGFLAPKAGPVAHPATANGKAGTADEESSEEEQDEGDADDKTAVAPEDAARR